MKRILAVDDDADILRLIERILTREQYEVVTADNGAQALEMIKQQSFDAVLLDIMMPGVDGFEVSRKLRQGNKKNLAPVIFITARDDSGALKEGFASGGAVFLSKPFTANQLLRIVQAMIKP
jgi:DNA-binding response OmpR family regulator